MKKFLSLITCFLSLNACGFAPMYSDKAPSMRREPTDIYIAPVEGTNGIDLRNRLLLAWNTPNIEGAKYTLNIKLNEPRTIYKGLLQSGDATWEEVRISASWILTADGKTIAKASETASESYTFVNDLVSANASKISATQNAIGIIGEKIETKVNAKLKD